MKTTQVVKQLYQTSRIFLKRNSATIFTCVGAVGVLGTAVLAVKATPKAMENIQNAKEEKGELTKLDIVKVAGPAYIPAGVVGLSTIACIFGANILNKKQQAALVSAYAVLTGSQKEYRDKVKELLGSDSDKLIREELAKDRAKKDKLPKASEGKVWFYEEHSNRFFESTLEKVLSAEYHFNRNFVLRSYGHLNEFLDFLGVERVPYGNVIGWSMEAGEIFYGYEWVDFDNVQTIFDDGREGYIIRTPFPPTADFIDVWDSM